ncbi:twin-arginine translocation signal domain-containing protein, partial [Stenotrophomonas pictorum]
MSSDFLSDPRPALSRRRFVQGLALGGVVAGAGLGRIP